MVTAVRNVKAVRSALKEGHITVPDPETGYQRQMYARCPVGHDASIHRVERHGPEITEVTMRCPTCGAQFIADVSRITLR